MPKYNVWITLVGTYETDNPEDAFEEAMYEISDREGMEIASHEIIEEE